MKKFSAIALALVVGAPTFAAAENNDSMEVRIAGTVEDICTVAFDSGTAEAVVTGGATTPATLSDDLATASFDTFIDNSDDPLDPSIGDISLVTITLTAELFCNSVYGAQIEATNGALVNSDALVNNVDFSDRLGYDVQVTFDENGTAPSFDGALTPSVDLDSPTTIADVQGSQHRGQITIAITASQATVLDTAGARDDTLNLIAGVYTEALLFSFATDGVNPPAAFNTVSTATALNPSANTP